MAPTTRSTPTKSPPQAVQATVAEESSPKVTPRKAPHCHKCQKPMRGHPKGGCSTPATGRDSPEAKRFIDSINSLNLTKDSQDDEDSEDIVPVTPKKPRKSTGRRSLTPRILPVEEDIEPEDTKAVIRERRRSERAAKQAISQAESLTSLDSNSVELIKNLVPEEEGSMGKEKVVHWKDEVPSSHDSTRMNGRVKLERAVMPCSLDPPSPWSSVISVAASQETASEDDCNAVSFASSQGPLGDSRSRATGKPLQRAMSMEERHQFLKKLEGLSSAQAYTISEADSGDLQPPKGFFTKTLPAGVAHPGQNILIVGKDEKDTQNLYERLKEEQVMSGSRRRSGGLTMAAGGVMIGAVATFAGLAY